MLWCQAIFNNTHNVNVSRVHRVADEKFHQGVEGSAGRWRRGAAQCSQVSEARDNPFPCVRAVCHVISTHCLMLVCRKKGGDIDIVVIIIMAKHVVLDFFHSKITCA